MSKISLLAIFLCIVANARAEPQLSSIFPIGGQRGSSFGITIQGAALENVKSVYFDSDQLSGRVERLACRQAATGSLIVTVHAKSTAKIGWHRFWLVGDDGISRPWSLLISEVPGVLENSASDDVDQPQKLELDSAVYGRIEEPGDADDYIIELQQGEEFSAEVVTTSGLFVSGPHHFQNPTLTLLQSGKSWFDPLRLSELRSADHSRTHFFPLDQSTAHTMPRLFHRASETGSYILRVTDQVGYGGDKFAYQLCVRRSSDAAAVWTPRRFVVANTLEWHEHSFTRKLGTDYVTRIAARSVANIADEEIETTSTMDSDSEYLDDQPIEITIPHLIKGAVEFPGDMDEFKFSVQQGDTLAFEIQTTKQVPPYFTPRLIVKDFSDVEVLNNTYRKIGGDGDDWIKSIEPKVLYTFDTSGEYRLQVRDITSRKGSADFTYHIMIRKQVPHIGRVQVKATHANVAAGGSARISATVHFEEGFSENISLEILNLPTGLEVIPAETATSDTGPPFPTVNEERFVAKRQEISALIVANKDAVATDGPIMGQVAIHSIVDGRIEMPVVVKNIPIMVTQ